MKEEKIFTRLLNAIDKVNDALPQLADLVHLADAREVPQNQWVAYGVTNTPEEYKQAIKQQIESAHNALNALWDEVERV